MENFWKLVLILQHEYRIWIFPPLFDCKVLPLFFTLQHFVEELSNHTGYPVSKLVGKKIWRVYDTLTCQVYLIFPIKQAYTNTTQLYPICILQFTNASITDTNSSCRAEGHKRDLFSSTYLQWNGRGWSAGNHFYTYSKTWIGQHIEMIIKALWDGWILGQVECAHSHLQNEHLLSSDRR